MGCFKSTAKEVLMKQEQFAEKDIVDNNNARSRKIFYQARKYPPTELNIVTASGRHDLKSIDSKFQLKGYGRIIAGEH